MTAVGSAFVLPVSPRRARLVTITGPAEGAAFRFGDGRVVAVGRGNDAGHAARHRILIDDRINAPSRGTSTA
jgi:hypothetical protein